MNKVKPVKRKPKVKATPVSRIASALRKIWLYSPERARAIKRGEHHCEECGCKGVHSRQESKDRGLPRLEIHHTTQCDITKLSKMIHQRMFPGEDKLDCLCVDCHKKADAILNKEKEL